MEPHLYADTTTEQDTIFNMRETKTLINDTSFQRRGAWSEEKKGEFIAELLFTKRCVSSFYLCDIAQSITTGIKTYPENDPFIVKCRKFQEQGYTHFVVDGNNRNMAIGEFITNKVSSLSKNNQYYTYRDASNNSPLEDSVEMTLWGGRCARLTFSRLCPRSVARIGRL